jgi:N6-L-threonylcarbamoyladenine synthase
MVIAMKILAIETSCDETAICLLEAVKTESGVNFSVHKNFTSTQMKLHEAFGGVFPMLAKREHIKNLPLILDLVMKDESTPDYICVTSGPGLEPALWTGIEFAKELGTKWNIPVIPVNHMEGHILSVLVPTPTPQSLAEPRDSSPYKGERPKFSFSNSIKFPALALLISGGHTELVLVNGIGDYKIIGKTRDDAVGEAFDKVARIMGLPYPGGPKISELAKKYRELPQDQKVAIAEFPRPMIHSKDYDFSFSGLKTAVLYFLQELQPKKDYTISGTFTQRSSNFIVAENIQSAVAYEFEEAAAEVISKKTQKAIDDFGIQSLIIGGGVAANNRIKEVLCSMLAKHFPNTDFLTLTR